MSENVTKIWLSWNIFWSYLDVAFLYVVFSVFLLLYPTDPTVASGLMFVTQLVSLALSVYPSHSQLVYYVTFYWLI